MDIAQVDTPALLLDLDMVERNLDAMAAQFDGGRVKLRPHAKTHKTATLARMQIADDLGQIVTVIFTAGVRNAPLGAPDFAFTAPKGTDVIGTPVH